MDENTQTINTDVKTQDFEAPGTTNIPGIGFNFSGLTNVPETKPIALDKIDTPVQDVSKIQQDIADSATITPGNLDTNVGAITQGRDIEIPDEQPIVEEQKELTMRELMEQKIRGDFAGIGGVDPIAETKRSLTENSGLIEQRTLARDIQQDMRTRQLDFQDAKDELLNNPTSSSRGVVNARVNDLTAKYQDRRARDLLQFSVANGNALEAEAVITERIAELNDQRDREDQLFERMFAFSQDNMSESEKQEALDRRAERSFEMQKELIDYKAYADSKKTEAFNPTRQKNLIELAELGDPQAINELGYNPAQLPGRVADKVKANEAKYADAISNVETMQKSLEEGDAIRSITGQVQGKALAFADSLFGIGKTPLQSSTDIAGVGNRLNAIDDLKSTVSFVVNSSTFQELLDLKEGGATFGSLTEGERIAIGRAANEFNAAVTVDEQGKFVEFNGSENKFRETFTEVMNGYSAVADQANADMLSAQDQLEIINL